MPTPEKKYFVVALATTRRSSQPFVYVAGIDDFDFKMKRSNKVKWHRTVDKKQAAKMSWLRAREVADTLRSFRLIPDIQFAETA